MAKRPETFGGAPRIGTITGEPEDASSGGGQEMFGGSPSVKDRLHKGEKQVGRNASSEDLQPDPFGGAPSIGQHNSKRMPDRGSGSGDKTGAPSGSSGTIP